MQLTSFPIMVGFRLHKLVDSEKKKKLNASTKLGSQNLKTEMQS